MKEALKVAQVTEVEIKVVTKVTMPQPKIKIKISNELHELENAN
jgi:hypothetical protein